MDGWNTTFLLGWPIFRCYVSFREGNHLFTGMILQVRTNVYKQIQKKTQEMQKPLLPIWVSTDSLEMLPFQSSPSVSISKEEPSSPPPRRNPPPRSHPTMITALVLLCAKRVASLGSLPRNGRKKSRPPSFKGSWPIGSMYGTFTYIWVMFMVNEGIYIYIYIHGSYGWYCLREEIGRENHLVSPWNPMEKWKNFHINWWVYRSSEPIKQYLRSQTRHSVRGKPLKTTIRLHQVWFPSKWIT